MLAGKWFLGTVTTSQTMEFFNAPGSTDCISA